MSIKPSPTIAGKLRKLFSNNKQTIEPAIDDTLPGGGISINFFDRAETPPQELVDYFASLPRPYDVTAAYKSSITAESFANAIHNKSVIYLQTSEYGYEVIASVQQNNFFDVDNYLCLTVTALIDGDWKDGSPDYYWYVFDGWLWQVELETQAPK